MYLLLAKCGGKLDPDYLFYECDFNTILFGVHAYKKDLHILDRNSNPASVEVHYYRNIVVTDRGDLLVQVKPTVKPFSNFSEYYNRLLSAMDLMYENAKDEIRKKKYDIVTTISKGYDAPCCAAIAKKIGCDTAVTFKAEGKYKEDSGVEIAQQLGYRNIIQKDAEEYRTRTDFVEAFYVASGELGAQISFCAFDAEFEGNLVLTGERGDSIWGKNAINRNNKFAFDDMLSHLGSCERKLWVGYISVPMPLFGASSWDSIYRISNSKEMQNWQLGNEYDRPIPRRIVEEAGVKREDFGQSKHGAGFVYRYDWLARIKSRMSSTSAENFESYVIKNKKPCVVEKIKYLWLTKEIYLSRIGISVKDKPSIEYSQIANPMAARYLIPWAGNIVLEKYKKILGE